MPYVAMKMDVVRSRKVRDRKSLQERLFAGVQYVNAHFGPAIVAEFTVTHGDEVQGMLHHHSAQSALAICEHLVDLLAPQKIRFGVGIGDLATDLQPVAIGMDGEAWYRASEALQKAHRQRKSFGIETGSPFDKGLSATIDYLLTHRMLWSDPQRQAVRLLDQLGSQQSVASHLKISKAAVSKRLSTCLWDQYASLRDVALEWLGLAATSQRNK